MDCDKITLEQLVDSLTLQGVIERLSSICYEKAEHIRENWQDEATGKGWAKGESYLAELADKLAELQI